MKLTLDQVRTTINNHLGFLQSEYRVKNMGVFGSVARNQNTKASDIDILVEFSQPVGLFKFIELEEYLSQVLGKRVDLVTKKALKPIIKKEVLQEVIYV